MRALSIRQPYVELILRGIKTVEYRTRATRIIGERFHIYASKRKLPVVSGQWSVKIADNIVVPREPLPEWMIELAEQVGMIEPGALLPTGVIVGSAVIENVSQVDSMYRWHLANVERAKKLRKPTGHPQPVWFRPF
jgi:predicted transcriptional regulator